MRSNRQGTREKSWRSTGAGKVGGHLEALTYESRLARTSDDSYAYRRFERVQEEAEERGVGLWSACPSEES